MTNEKITLPRGVSESIERLRSKGYTDAHIVHDIERGISSEVLNEYFYDKASPDDLMRALVIGYEVERTPEERLRDYYEYLQRIKSDSIYDDLRAEAVEETLDILGITVEGINDKEGR